MKSKKWVAGWGAATSYTGQNHADYFKDQTFRWVFFPTVDAEAIRLRFSNRYGTENCTLTKVTVAKSLGSHRIDTSTLMPVTFGGGASLTMAPDGEYVSDPAEFAVKAGEEFTLSLYFADYTQLQTGHSNNGPFIKKYYAKGDLTESESIPLELRGDNGPYVFLHTIDFLTSDDNSAIVAFGDSITAQPWPDYLAHRIFNLGIRNRTVIRRGIGGNRILRDYRWRLKMHWGEAGIKRFEQDVTGTVGADKVIVLHGINDLLHPAVNSEVCPMTELPTAGEMIDGYKKYIEITHRHKMKIYLATILPSARIAGVEGDRVEIHKAVNDWIRNRSGADGVIDFAAAVQDPENPDALLQIYDSGDKLHPSLVGAECLANTVPEAFILS